MGGTDTVKCVLSQIRKEEDTTLNFWQIELLATGNDDGVDQMRCGWLCRLYLNQWAGLWFMGIYVYVYLCVCVYIYIIVKMYLYMYKRSAWAKFKKTHTV